MSLKWKTCLRQNCSCPGAELSDDDDDDDDDINQKTSSQESIVISHLKYTAYRNKAL